MDAMTGCKCKFGECRNSCECRCHLAIEAHCAHSFKVGISAGLEQAAGVLMQDAQAAFINDRDEEAKMLRKMAATLNAKAKEAHPGPNPEYPEE